MPTPFNSTPEPVPLPWLGDLLIAARKQQGITQAELAERIGSHQAAIARWEGGKYRSAEIETIFTIARALDLELLVTASPIEVDTQSRQSSATFSHTADIHRELLNRGDLIDVTKADEVRSFFMFDTFMTRAVKDALHVSDEALYQKRLDTLLRAARDEIDDATERAHGWSDPDLEVEVLLEPEVKSENPLTPEEHDDLKLKAIIAVRPDDNQDPVFTIMLPWE